MEKKMNFGPLKLDKKTIAKLDDAQLEKIKGGTGGNAIIDPAQPGTTACTRNTCRGGTSTCFAGVTEVDE